jgi:septum formation protein
MRLILASRSESRRRMLEAAGVPFSIRTGETDEEGLKERCRALGMDARTLALALAEQKAMDVPSEPGEIVLGADQILECSDGSMLDKPQSREDAVRQLKALSGRRHRLHSAAVAVEAQRSAWRAVETAVMTVRPLSESFIDAYLDAVYEDVRHSVGCYHAEDRGAQLFDAVDGSHFAVLGLPLLPLLGLLRERGVLQT